MNYEEYDDRWSGIHLHRVHLSRGGNNAVIAPPKKFTLLKLNKERLQGSLSTAKSVIYHYHVVIAGFVQK